MGLIEGSPGCNPGLSSLSVNISLKEIQNRFPLGLRLSSLIAVSDRRRLDFYG
jgi:hypothetical protein